MSGDNNDAQRFSHDHDIEIARTKATIPFLVWASMAGLPNIR